MSKKTRASRRAKRQRQQRKTNWPVIGGVIAIGIILLGALLFLALRTPESQTLADFCLENPANCIARGASDAPVTIVEVSDYGCSHCRDFNLETAGLIEDLYVAPGQVKWVVMPFALSSQSLPAASAAMCAGDQGRFFEFHRRMFELQGGPLAMTPAGLLQAADELGLDTEAFNTCLESGEYDSAVQANIREANALGVRSTPTFFINGQKMEGNRPLTVFQQEISASIGAAGADADAG
jgi:protein-disulfide isomerase